MKTLIMIATVSTALFLSLAQKGFADSSGAKLFSQGLTLSTGNPATFNFAKLTPKSLEISNLLGSEARSILMDPTFKARIQAALAALQSKWDEKSEKLNLPKRGFTFGGLMGWVRLEITQGNTGVDVELRVPADFNAGGQPTSETVLAGYTDDEFLNLLAPLTRQTVYRE